MIYNNRKNLLILNLDVEKEEIPEIANSIIDSINSLAQLEEQNGQSKAFPTNIYHLTQLLKTLIIDDDQLERMCKFS